MAVFDNAESLEEFKHRLNSLTEKLSKTEKSSKQDDFQEARKW
jgi:hypothetical protein